MEFGTLNNLSMLSLMAMFILSVMDQKHPFWANLD